jgi:succinate dehydrogenase / fumarate reductase cytochrome b subunit
VRRTPFLLRRLHALTGVVPLSLFFVEHVWTNAAALGGRAHFDAAVGEIQALPGLWALEIFGIFIPLAFHAVYGIFIARNAKTNVDKYPYGRNWAYYLQRASGVVILLFLLVHLWELRVQKAIGGLDDGDFYDLLAASFGRLTFGVPVRAITYLIGLAATAFHFSNGLVGATQSFGLVVTRPAQRRVAWAAGALGTMLFLVGAATVLHLATGLFRV